MDKDIKDIILALTEKGKELAAKIQEGSGTVALEITRIVSGTGVSAEPEKLTDLLDPRLEFQITSRASEGERATISTLLTNVPSPGQSALAEGYSLTQVGFYALDPDEGEILYKISQYLHPMYVPALHERPLTYAPKFNITVGNASEVIVHVDPAGLVTQEMLDAALAGLSEAAAPVAAVVFPGEDINAAIQLAGDGGGGTVLLREGVHSATTPVVMDRPNVTLRGSGRGTILRRDAAALLRIVEITADGCRTADFLADYRLEELPHPGEPDPNSMAAIDAYGATGLHVAGLWVRGHHRGVQLQNSKRCIVASNDAEGGACCGILAQPGCEDVTIVGNVCTDNEYGITVLGKSSAVSGNVCSSNRRNGLRIGGKHIAATGNSCVDNLIGLELAGAATGCLVSGNITARGDGSAADYDQGGGPRAPETILIAPGAKHSYVTGNYAPGKTVSDYSGNDTNTIVHNKHADAGDDNGGGDELEWFHLPTDHANEEVVMYAFSPGFIHVKGERIAGSFISGADGIERLLASLPIGISQDVPFPVMHNNNTGNDDVTTGVVRQNGEIWLFNANYYNTHYFFVSAPV